jgi:cysteine-rich repeat protein
LCSRGGSDSADTCRTTCGDGLLAGHEACDDANNLNGDGCSADCSNVETEWTCTNTPCGQTLCMPVCGDGVRVGKEQCDDSGLANRDGCSSTCTVECGYACNSEGADCRTICGDGTVAGNETCDDDNENDGDGCSSSCSIERGWGCVNAVCLPSFCQSADGSEVSFFVLILNPQPSWA